MDGTPLVLTLALDAGAEAFFNALRQQHFPPARNFLAAHLTLFHHLPHAPEIATAVETLCAHQQPFKMEVTSVVSIGRGVAYKIESEPLQQLHHALQQYWQPWLIPQDRQRLWPHVTVQNKVTPQQARALLEELQQSFLPFAAQAVGLRLWRYLGGPWEALQAFSFAGA